MYLNLICFHWRILTTEMMKYSSLIFPLFSPQFASLSTLSDNSVGKNIGSL